MAELDNNKKYAFFGKYLNAYIDICNKDFISNYSNRTSSFIKIKKDKTNE